MPTNDTLVTTADAAARLGISHRAAVRLVQTGALEPAQKLPGLRGAYLFHPEDVEALAVARRGDAA